MHMRTSSQGSSFRGHKLKVPNSISHGSITIENITYDVVAPFSPEPVNYGVAGLLGFNNH